MTNSMFESIQDELRTIACGNSVKLSPLAQSMLSTTVEFIQKDSLDTLEALNVILRRFAGQDSGGATSDSTNGHAEKRLAGQYTPSNPFDEKTDSYLNITFKKRLNPHQVVFSVDTNVDLETSPYASYYELCDSQLYLNGRLTSPFRNVKVPFERILRSLGEYFEKRLNHLSFSHGSFVMLMKPSNNVQSVAIHEIIVDIVKYELYGKTDEPTDLHVRVEK